MTWTLWTAVAALLLTGNALAVTPAEKCERDMNKEVGKYVECRQTAEAQFALTASATVRARALQRCADKYGEKWPKIESKAAGACPSRGDQTPIQHYLDTATTDVAAALAGGPLAGSGHRLKTGQTQCWTASGQAIPCAGTGKDGELQAGLDRLYVDNGDGTVTDMRSGLMWEKLSDDGSIHDKDWTYSWPEAFLYKVANLNVIAFAGYTDWRVPNINELHGLVNLGAHAPAISPAFNAGCTAGCNVLTCSCTSLSRYWSSSSAAPYPTRAWTVSFGDGHVTQDGKGYYDYTKLRAVRGGS